MKISLISPGKINLFLYVTGIRHDGYHLVQTLFQLLDYGDIITVRSTKNKNIRLFDFTKNTILKKNLIITAAKLLQDYYYANKKNTPGADIYLTKKLPIGGGLGGGSSNAATTLLSLNIAWKCNVKINTLSQLGLKLGADIPFFIHGHSAYAEGIGEILTPITLPEKWYVIIKPPINISTSLIFNNYPLQQISPYRKYKNLLNIPFKNDCELITKNLFPTISLYLSWLLKYTNVQLTGTGSCLFATCNTKCNAQKLKSLIPPWMHSFIAKGINISPVHKALKIKKDEY